MRNCRPESSCADTSAVRNFAGSAILVLALTCVVAACSGDPASPSPPACTEEFRSWVVTAIDSAGSPVDGLEVAVTRPLTGERLPYGDPFLSFPGAYRIMDDGFVSTIRIEGETIRAEGSGGGVVGFSASWEFGADAWRCHVTKISGPDTVLVARE